MKIARVCGAMQVDPRRKLLQGPREPMRRTGPGIGEEVFARRGHILGHFLVRRHWDRKAHSWDDGTSPGLESVVRRRLRGGSPELRDDRCRPRVRDR